MNLLRTYFKLLIIKNRLNYLFVIISIIATYLMISITMIYIDNIIILSTDTIYSNMHYIYIGIRTIFFIAGITFIMNQYDTIMKSSIKDYCILRGLGATKHHIQCLVFIQVLFLIIISIPVGLYGGYLLTGLMIRFLSNFTYDQNTMNWIASSNTFYMVAGATFFLIISIGIYLEIGIRKMPLSNIFSGSPIIDKEG